MTDRIKVIEGLQAIRARPAMYIGPVGGGQPRCAQLAERVLSGFAREQPAPSAVRLVAFAERAITIAIEGRPISITPVAHGAVSHPALYELFLRLSHARSEANFGATCVNALSERLVVWTRSEGGVYRAAFSRGGIVGLLAPTKSTLALGDAWLTFVPDEALIEGALDAAAGASIAERVRASVPGVRVTFEDRLDEPADWW